MSIASEITRLQNAKNALKTSINAKTDAQHQIDNETLEDYASFVDSIQGGLTIQNGTIENYKSYSNVIPAGTFIKLKSIISTSSLNSLLGVSFGYIQNIIKMSSTRAVVIGLSGTSIIVGLLEINDEGFNKLSNTITFTGGISAGYVNDNTLPLAIKVDTNHLAVCSGCGSTMYFNLISIENDILSIIKTTNTITTNYKNNKDIGLLEDNDNYYVITTTAMPASATGQNVHTFIIDKNTYAVTKTQNYDNGVYAIGNGTINKDNYLYNISSKYSNGYLQIHCRTWNGSSVTTTDISLLPLQVYAIKLFALNNRYFILYSDSSTLNNLKYLELDLNNNTVAIINRGTLLETTDPIFINSYFTINILNNCALMLYKETTTGEVLTRTLTTSNNGLNINITVPISVSSTEENTYKVFRQQNAIQLNDNILLTYLDSIGLYKIINNQINTVSGAGIVVIPTTDYIQGVTNTECTTDTAGEVYILDTSS